MDNAFHHVHVRPRRLRRLKSTDAFVLKSETIYVGMQKAFGMRMHVPKKIGLLFLAVYLILTGVISIFDTHPISDDILAIVGFAVGGLLLFDL